MSSLLGRALVVEGMKTATGTAPRGASVALVVGTLVLAVGMSVAVEAGNEMVLDRLGPLGRLDGWPRLLGVVAQVASAASTLAFGVALSWMFGREFADGTITGLFALPVPRPLIALAKLIVFVAWATVTAVVLAAGTVAVGFALGYGPPDGAWAAVGRQLGMTVLSALVVTPVAWVTTLTRSVLGGVAATVAVIVVAQVSVIVGAGGWMPLAAPALWAVLPHEVSLGQLAAVLIVPVLFGAVTPLSWARMQLDR